MKIKPTQLYKSNIIVVIIYLILSLGIILAGFFFYNRQRNRTENDIKNQLLSISHYKSEQISNWVYDRLNSAEIISTAFPINSLLQEFLVDPLNIRAENNLSRMMESYMRCYGYESINLLDEKESLLISIPNSKTKIHYLDLEINKECYRKKEVMISDLHKNDVDGRIELNIHIPLLSISIHDTTALGTLICSIDPNKFLFPLIIIWPVMSFSAESFIVRHEGDNLLYLSELRFMENAALNFSQPDTNENLPAAMAAHGKEGIVEGEDYRGANVVAAITKIKHTPWFLVSKQDADEIYELLRKGAFVVSSVIILLLVIAGFGTTFYLKRNNLAFYKELYKKELEKNVLAKHFDYLIKYANDIILLINPDGVIVEANNKAVMTYGFEKDELIGMDIKNLLDNVEQNSMLQLMAKIDEEDGVLIEKIHKKKDGTIFPVEISARVIEIDSMKFYQGIIRDITERKKHEELLSEALLKAQESDKLKSEFLALMSHEVRTPLNAVINYANLIKEQFGDTLTEDDMEMFSGMDDNGKRIIKTMDTILNVSQLKAGIFVPNFENVNLTEVLQKLIENFGLEARSKRLELRFTNLVENPIVFASPYCVTQIFSHLIDNALEFTEKGFVEIRVLKDFANVVVEIKDTGIGISDDFMYKLFEPFAQAEHAYTRKHEGNGLGLALVKGFCDLNKAVIEVESKKNIGSTFRVKFTT